MILKFKIENTTLFKRIILKSKIENTYEQMNVTPWFNESNLDELCHCLKNLGREEAHLEPLFSSHVGMSNIFMI